MKNTDWFGFTSHIGLEIKPIIGNWTKSFLWEKLYRYVYLVDKSTYTARPLVFLGQQRLAAVASCLSLVSSKKEAEARAGILELAAAAAATTAKEEAPAQNMHPWWEMKVDSGSKWQCNHIRRRPTDEILPEKNKIESVSKEARDGKEEDDLGHSRSSGFISSSHIITTVLVWLSRSIY